MHEYNPFEKQLTDLVPTDLKCLTAVNEGWYVEYKREVPSADLIARSICSFANQYGGWLFFGIDEAEDENVAGAFPGIDRTEIPKLKDRIRDGVKTHINPIPHFEIRTLEGPEATLSLPPERAVIVVLVGEGGDPPYVHSSGRIYRRVGDCKHPVSEKDRGLLDQLWQRGRRSRKRLKERLEASSKLARRNEHVTYLTTFMIPDLYIDGVLRPRLTTAQFAEIMTSAGSIGIEAPCDNVYTMALGWVARQIADNSPMEPAFSWFHYVDSASVVTSALNQGTIGERTTEDTLSRYRYGIEFLELCRTAGYEDAVVLDTNHQLALLMAFFTKQHRLLKAAGLPPRFYSKAKLGTLVHRIPFLDTGAFMNAVASHGIPLIQDDDTYAPASTDPDTFIEVTLPDSLKGSLDVLEPAVLLFTQVAGAVGIMEKTISESGTELVEAWQRAAAPKDASDLNDG